MHTSHAPPLCRRRWYATLASVLLASTLLLAAGGSAVAEEQGSGAPAAPRGSSGEVDFPWAGEEFYYSIRVNGVEAVRSAVRAGEVRYKAGSPYVAVSGQAQSTGLFSSIYPIDDRAHTFLSPSTLRPLRSEKYFDENGRQRNYLVDWVHSTYQARVLKEMPKRQHSFTRAVPGTTHDMITWFFDLRSQAIEVGETFSFYVYDGWKLSRLDAKVVGRDDVYTPMGWFKAWRIDFAREVLNSHNKRGKPPLLKVRNPSEHTGTMWLSRDENLLPIKVALDTKWGVGEAVLIKYTPGEAARRRQSPRPSGATASSRR